MKAESNIYPIEIDPFFAEDLRQMERAVNYQHWQFDMVKPFLGKRVLEIGGGIGNFTTKLSTDGRSVASIEPNEYCFRQLVEKTRGLTNVRPLHATVELLNAVLEPDERFDSVVLMNVLEHIRDDHAALMALAARLGQEGRVVVLVPAGPWAFGPTDERLGHFRRYCKRSARHLFLEAGLRVEHMRYYNFVGIWGWWWNARFGKRTGQSNLQIRVFDRCVVPVLSRLEHWVCPPLGQSLLIVGRTIAS